MTCEAPYLGPRYGRATAPWVRFCHILHSTHHSARSRRTRAVSDSTASSGRNSASSRSPALVLGCPFLSFSSTFRSRHQSLYLSSMVGYSNPEIQICKSAKDTPGCTLRSEILVEVPLLSPWRSPCRRGTRVIISTPFIPVHVTFAHRVTTCTGSTDKERRLSRSTRNP